MKKKMIRLASFLCLAALMLTMLSQILCVKSNSGIDQARNLYAQPANTVDVLFLGSSHVHCNIDTRVLWEQQGIAAYLCTTAEQPVWNSYYYLVEALKYQKPELVVVDMFGPARFEEDIQEKWLAENLGGMRVSLNKYQAVVNSAPSEHISWLLGYPRYHDRYGKLTEADFQNFWWNRAEKASWKGYVEMTTHAGLTEPDMSRVTDCEPMTEKSRLYFEKIISLCKKEGIDLLFLSAPYLLEESDQRVYNEIGRLAKEAGLLFMNYNQTAVYREMGMDFALDFADHAHLNAQGAQKYSAHLAEWLKQHYEIPDRRGQDGYESWENQTVSPYVPAQ